MKHIILGVLAAGSLLAAAPAGAQVRIEGPDVGIRVGRDHDSDWRRHHRNCRTVTVRERKPNGDVVVRKRERC